MGLNFQSARMLWDARLAGASFEKTATLGHLSLRLHPRELAFLRTAYRRQLGASAEDPLIDYRFGDWADPFFRGFLGAREITIVDNSSFEGADFLHDMNRPIPASLQGRFDAVVDAGTLEHVFNAPVAIANAMAMASVGGKVFLALPANNFCGHGFYQFSPEFVFRVFTAANGFRLDQVMFARGSHHPEIESLPMRRTYRVADPEIVGHRVELMSCVPIAMLVEATRVRECPLFAEFPQQSDYVRRWELRQSEAPTSEGGWRAIRRRMILRLPLALRNWVVGWLLRWRRSLLNRRLFTKV
jgi:hypothetical protein